MDTSLAHRVVDRPTEDLDLFADHRRTQVRPIEAGRALAAAVTARGWDVTWIREFADYARRMIATDHGPLLVDLVRETVEQPPTITVVGPTVSEQDAAVGKLIALFDRAEACDVVDVYEFAHRFAPHVLLELDQRRDPGFDTNRPRGTLSTHHRAAHSADMPDSYQDRFEDIRAFYMHWRDELDT